MAPCRKGKPIVRDREVHLGADGRLFVGRDSAGAAWLELANSADKVRCEPTEGELLMTLEALAMLYADLVGANAASVATGINRTLANRTRAARERRQHDRKSAA